MYNQEQSQSVDQFALSSIKSDCGTDTSETPGPSDVDYESTEFWNIQVPDLTFIRLISATQSSLVWLASRAHQDPLAVKIVERIQSEGPAEVGLQQKKYFTISSPQNQTSNEGYPSINHPSTGLSSQFIHQQNELNFLQTHHLPCMPKHQIILLPEFILFVEPYCPLGSLSNYIYHHSSNNSLRYGSEHMLFAVNTIKSIVQAVKLVHSLGYVHRDLKPDNVLVVSTEHKQINETDRNNVYKGKNYKVWLCDFNLISKIGQIDQSLCGTLEYMSPERLLPASRSKKAVTVAQDIWSIGIILYELLTGNLPFPGDDPEQILQKVYDGFIPELDKIPQNAREVITGCLQIVGEKRMTIDQILESQFITGVSQLTKSESPLQQFNLLNSLNKLE